MALLAGARASRSPRPPGAPTALLRTLDLLVRDLLRLEADLLRMLVGDPENLRRVVTELEVGVRPPDPVRQPAAPPASAPIATAWRRVRTEPIDPVRELVEVPVNLLGVVPASTHRREAGLADLTRDRQAPRVRPILAVRSTLASGVPPRVGVVMGSRLLRDWCRFGGGRRAWSFLVPKTLPRSRGGGKLDRCRRDVRELCLNARVPKGQTRIEGARMRRALVTGITGTDGSYPSGTPAGERGTVPGSRRASSFNTGRIDHLYRDTSRVFGCTSTRGPHRRVPARPPDPDRRARRDHNFGAQAVMVSFEQPEYLGM